MKKRLLKPLTIAVAALFLASCAANVHVVGDGPHTGQKIKKKQWYVIWGLVPINEVDTQAMAAGATDYQIKTVYGVDDCIANLFLNYVSVGMRTVEVTK